MAGAPLIGITPNRFPARDRAVYAGKALEYSDVAMAEAVVRAGGVPVLLVRGAAEAAAELVDRAEAGVGAVQGLLLAGGADVAPQSYGQRPLDPAWAGEAERDRWELALYRVALAAGRPVLGVCRGLQLLNVAEGGTLWQDLPSQRDTARCQHRCQARYDRLEHPIEIEAGSELRALLGSAAASVSSVHHQGIDELGLALRAVARAPDGLVEAARREGSPWVFGVQWHPEWMPEDAGQARIFARFVEQAAQVAR